MKLGRDLKVRYVLEGSIQRTDDRLRVTAQLIDTETGTHVWADRFDREMADVFLVQDEIVSQIVGKIAGGYGVIESTEAKSADAQEPQRNPGLRPRSARAERDAVEYNRETYTLGERIVAPGDRPRSVERASAPRAGLARCGWLGLPLRRDASAAS